MGRLNISLVISIMRSHSALVAMLAAMFAPHAARGDDTKKPDHIRIAIYSGQGVTPGDAEQVKSCLPATKEFAVLITAKEIRDGSLAKYVVLIHPGGSGMGQSQALGDDGRKRVRLFVRDGGGFVGICAGAYLASIEYPWALKLIDAIVPEPTGGAHNDHDRATALVDQALGTALAELAAMSDDARLAARYEKFRRMGEEGQAFVDGGR